MDEHNSPIPVQDSMYFFVCIYSTEGTSKNQFFLNFQVRKQYIKDIDILPEIVQEYNGTNS
jgi:hypothetical protein